MAAIFFDLLFAENGNFVAEFAGRKAVRNIESGFAICQVFVEFFVDFGFGQGVKGGGRLVQNYNRGFFP